MSKIVLPAREVPVIAEADVVIAGAGSVGLEAALDYANLGKDVTVILNFTPVAHVDHHINVPLPGKYREVFNSDDPQYGGSGVLNTGIMEAFPVKDNFLHRVRVSVPPLGCTILERIPDEPPKASPKSAKAEK